MSQDTHEEDQKPKMSDFELGMLHLKRWHRAYNLLEPMIFMVYPTLKAKWDANDRFNWDFRPNYYVTAHDGNSVQGVKFQFDHQKPHYDV